MLLLTEIKYVTQNFWLNFKSKINSYLNKKFCFKQKNKPQIILLDPILSHRHIFNTFNVVPLTASISFPLFFW